MKKNIFWVFLYSFFLITASESEISIISQLTSSEYDYNFENTPQSYYEGLAALLETKKKTKNDIDALQIALEIDFCFRDIIHKYWPSDFTKVVDDKRFLDTFNCGNYKAEFAILAQDVAAVDTYLSIYKNFALYTLLNAPDLKTKAQNYLAELFYKTLQVDTILELSKLDKSLMLNLINHITIDSIKSVFDTYGIRKEQYKSKNKKAEADKLLQALRNFTSKLSKPGSRELLDYMEQVLAGTYKIKSLPQKLHDMNQDLTALAQRL